MKVRDIDPIDSGDVVAASLCRGVSSRKLHGGGAPWLQRTSVWLLFGFGMIGLKTRADNELPARFKFDRYQKMLDRSSFAVRTPSTRTTPSFASSLYVASVAKMENGESIVTIRSADDASFELRITQTRPKEQ